MTVPRRTRTLAIVMVLALVALAGCTGSASSPSAGAMVASGAWARASMSIDRAVAVYLSIENQTGADDSLLSVASPAGTAELHETMTGDAGMMAMQPVDKIALAKGETVELKSGSYHIMLINLASMLEPGASIELTLTFEHAAPVTVTAEVRAN